MGNFGRNLAIWLVLGLIIVAVYNLANDPTGGKASGQLVYSDFLKEVQSGKISTAIIEGNSVQGLLADGKTPYVTFTPQDPGMVDRLIQNNVRVSAPPPPENNTFMSILVSWFPMLLFIGIWIFFMRQMNSGGNKAMGFGKSKAKLMETKKKVTFADVAGIDEAKEEVEEIVEFLRTPLKFQKLGGKLPKGVLLVGPPGTGKTLLARAIAGEAGVPFFSISGSDFVEMFVGVGASRVRNMFEQAKKSSPCIIFIDEIDAVGRNRGAGHGGGNDEREQTLNQLLVEMDGFDENESVIIIAATNRADVLDPALLRPGRFDRQVYVSLPDVEGRTKILDVHLKKIKVGKDIVARTIARGTPGFSGADLANLVNEAALMAARASKKLVSMRFLEMAKDKVMMGVERKSMIITDEEKKLTAYHEGGHALVSILCPASDPIHKATIIPRGRALGMVMRLPEKDRVSVSREKLMADLAVAAGGRLAEELIFGHDKITTGASSDIKMVTEIAKRMITEWGMSDELGFMSYAASDRDQFFGITVDKNMSDDTSKVIDREIRKIVDSSYERARAILKKHIKDLHKIAAALIEYETLTGDEIKIIMDGGKIIRKIERDEKKPRVSASVPTKKRKKIFDAGGLITPKPQEV